MDVEKIKSKVRKLLSLGNDAGAFEGEIDNALKFARRLMLRHNLTETDLKRSTDPHEAAADVEYGATDVYSTTNHLCGWERHLIYAVCGLVGTVQWYKERGETVRRTVSGTVAYGANGRATKAQRFVFYGPAEDCRDARDLFEEWAHVTVVMARVRHGSAFKGDGRNYAEGFTVGLYEKVERLHEAERLEIEDAPEKTTALVLAGAHEIMLAKRTLAKDWLAEAKGIRLQSSRRGGRGGSRNAGAFADGKRDGERASFQHARLKKLEG